MMRKVVILPDIRLKIPDIVVECASFDRPETLEIAPKAFSRCYENLVFIPDST